MTRRRKSRPAPPHKNEIWSKEKETESGSLQEEINMLRTLMRLVENLADEGKPVGELLKMLDILGKSSTRLASLLRAQRELCEENEFGSVFNQALAEVIKELGISNAE
jgi:hypothetical protein